LILIWISKIILTNKKQTIDIEIRMTTMQRSIQTINNPWSMFKIKLILPDQEYYNCIQDKIKSLTIQFKLLLV